jgi:hypothetical protein
MRSPSKVNFSHWAGIVSDSRSARAEKKNAPDDELAGGIGLLVQGVS